MNLQPSDLLLWRIDSEASWFERLIGWGERQLGEQQGDVAYYHVGICGPDALHYYDSAPGGVKNRNVPDWLPDHVEVYRFKIAPAPAQLAKMFSYANSQIGTGYNYIGVLTAGWIEVAGKPFCSELVWRICTYAGIVICPWQTCLSPDDVASSPLLERVCG
jgi:uncharacterized protein YycO